MFKLITTILLIFSYKNLTVESRSANADQNNLFNNKYDLKQNQFNKNNEYSKNTENDKINSYFWNDLSMLFKLYQECFKDSSTITVCLKVKLLSSLNKIELNSKEINLIDGIKFVEDEEKSFIEKPKIINEKEIIENLPRSIDDKESTLNYMIFDKLLAFVKHHSLQIKFSEPSDEESGVVEGRKKKDKKGQGAFIMIPLLLGGTFVPIAYGALALLAGKALIVSKLALVLASIIGIKKLLGGGGHKESQHEVVVSGGHSGSGWGRDFDLAYNAYNNKPSDKKA